MCKGNRQLPTSTSVLRKWFGFKYLCTPVRILVNIRPIPAPTELTESQPPMVGRNFYISQHTPNFSVFESTYIICSALYTSMFLELK